MTNSPKLEDIADILQDFWTRSGGSPEIRPSVLLAMISPDSESEKGQFSVLKVLGSAKLPATEMVAYSTQLAVRSLLRLVHESAKEEGNPGAVNLPNVLTTLFAMQLEGLGIPGTAPIFAQAVNAIFTAKMTEHVLHVTEETPMDQEPGPDKELELAEEVPDKVPPPKTVTEF